MKLGIFIGCLAVTGLSLSSCANDMEKVRHFDRQTLPQQIVEDAEVEHSEKGQRQMRLVAPYIYKYSKPDAKTVYPKGVEVSFYNTDTVSSHLTARYAIELEERNILMAKDSVVIIDYTEGDTIYLHDIIWNRKEKRIYSNHPVRAVNGSRVTYGDGFLSDDRFENPVIYRQRGTIEWVE